MTKIARLFSLRGRTSRRNYWRFQLWGTLVMAVVWCGGLLLAINTGVGSISAVGLAGAAVLVLASLATVVRRLHDRNKSGWWLAPLYLFPLSADMALGQMKGLVEQYPLPTAAVALVSLGLLLWFFVELGLLKGTAGANRYGEDPVATGPHRTAPAAVS